MSEIHSLTGASCYKERIFKENEARREWSSKYGAQWGEHGSNNWRPVEPYEQSSCSRSALERPEMGVPLVAQKFPKMFIDTVGDQGLVGGTPKQFGGHWDCTTSWQPGRVVHPDAPVRSHEKGPHDCYLPIGHGCDKPPPRSKFGLKSSWTGMYTKDPGALAMVWVGDGTEDEDDEGEDEEDEKR